MRANKAALCRGYQQASNAMVCIIAFKCRATNKPQRVSPMECDCEVDGGGRCMLFGRRIRTHSIGAAAAGLSRYTVSYGTQGRFKFEPTTMNATIPYRRITIVCISDYSRHHSLLLSNGAA